MVQHALSKAAVSLGGSVPWTFIWVHRFCLGAFRTIHLPLPLGWDGRHRAWSKCDVGSEPAAWAATMLLDRLLWVPEVCPKSSGPVGMRAVSNYIMLCTCCPAVSTGSPTHFIGGSHLEILPTPRRQVDFVAVVCIPGLFERAFHVLIGHFFPLC